MYRPALRHIAFSIAALCWQTGAFAATPLDQTKSLSISQQPLSSSLISLGKANGVSIIFPSHLVNHCIAQPLEGTLSTRQALDSLLEQTNLTYREISPRVIAIIPKPDAPLAHDTDDLSFEEMMVIGRSVTGSRLSRNDLEGSSPVDIISAPELARSGTQSLAEFLKFVPAVSGNSTSTAVSNGGDGTATVTLRGLPANNTLVLVNGQRIAFDGLAGDAVDLNSISPAAVERIEILKDGASAIYGSDAIAGVVNIVMKQDFEGFQVEQYYGESSRGDLETVSTNFLWGTHSERSGMMLSISHHSQNGLFSKDRDISSNADGRDKGGSDQRTSATENSRITLDDGSVVIYDNGIFRPATDEDLFNYRDQTSSISPSSRSSLYASGYLLLGDQLKATTELSYSDTKAQITLASVPLYTAFEDIDLPVSADNIYNPLGYEITDIRRRISELAPREQLNESKNYRLNFGLEKLQGDNFLYGNIYWSRSEASEKTTGLLDGQNVQRALGPSDNCQGTMIDGCEPLNLFGPNGSITEKQLAYIATDSQEEGFSQLYGANLHLSAPVSQLSSGPLLFSTGFDLRREEISITTKNPVNSTQIGGANIGNTAGVRSIREIFFELQAPLAKHRPGIFSLDLELAIRHSYYSDFGGNTSPKIGLRYRPTQDLLIRSTYSEGFRAPSLDELHKGGYQTQAFLDDPCSIVNNVDLLDGCITQSDPTRIQYLTEFSGDEELSPEESQSHTFGFVWTPINKGALSLSLDHFWIRQKNVVDASPQTILNENAKFGSFEDLVERDSSGNLTHLTAPFINIGEREIRGVDLSGTYQWTDFKKGTLSLSLAASYLYEYLNKVSTNSPTEDLSGTYTDAATEGNGSIPEWKLNAGLVWSIDSFELTYNMNFISSLTEKIPQTTQTRTIDSWTTHDVQLSYQMPIQAGLQVTLGVDNIFDEEPPFASAAFNDSFDARTYDLKGRFWYLRLGQSF
ncbi:MAG: TonB-dependent receptor [Cellvibrionaceae bacterium]